ncbi:putative transcriptional regulator [Klebsiella phage vB_KpnS-VAC2]|uniref:Transcriptional regulator n=1 Tax=Klebsiella phage vB_KpnS-VAC2 TaxID=2864369 RepID=A0AAE8BY19_9CAUD|nr:putative transcriptional regulator [Klebsiella phage vB_KpnS-VAC2]
MKLYPDPNDPAAPMRLSDEPVEAQAVIDAVLNASQAENPSALECVTGDLFLMSFLPDSESYTQHVTETGQAVTRPEFIGAPNVLQMMLDNADNIVSLDYPQ